MEKINVAELLKDCPQGMELDCPMYNKVTLLSVDDREDIVFPIRILREDGNSISLTKYGQFTDADFAKCVIFPKGKTTWEGFQRPFKDGDILTNDRGSIHIYKGPMYYNKNLADFYCGYRIIDCAFILNQAKNLHFGDIKEMRLSTEEEKQKLFDAIKDNGYKWNAETKTLEKLVEPKFKVGDRIKTSFNAFQYDITELTNTHYTLVEVEHKFKYTEPIIEDKNWELVPNKIEPKFKVGDWITNGEYTWKVISVDYLDYTLQNQLGESVDDTIDYVNKAFHLWTINDAKDGDVLFHSDSASNGIFIFKEILQRGTLQKVICYCDYDSEDGFCLGENHTCCWADSKILYPATKERCDILFQKMKEACYKWNVETKTLEKLIEPKFKVGDRIVEKNGITKPFTISQVGGGYYYSNDKNAVEIMRIEDQDKYELINEPKFKVGDNIRIIGESVIHVVTEVRENLYILDTKDISLSVKIQDQYQWELVPRKFDIRTLIPFESKVLVRDSNSGVWKASFWGCLIDSEYGYKYDTVRGGYRQCIPYKNNEYLLGKSDDCNEYYKTW